jgi:hypothetical protein
LGNDWTFEIFAIFKQYKKVDGRVDGFKRNALNDDIIKLTIELSSDSTGS